MYYERGCCATWMLPAPRSRTLPTKISKTTPCKVAGGRWHGCFERIPRKHFDTSGKSAALFHHRAIKRPWPCPTTGCSARLQGQEAALLPGVKAGEDEKLQSCLRRLQVSGRLLHMLGHCAGFLEQDVCENCGQDDEPADDRCDRRDLPDREPDPCGRKRRFQAADQG